MNKISLATIGAATIGAESGIVGLSVAGGLRRRFKKFFGTCVTGTTLVLGLTAQTPKQQSTQKGAFSINAKGAITGAYVDANNRTHGFVRRAGGEIVSFDAP